MGPRSGQVEPSSNVIELGAKSIELSYGFAAKLDPEHEDAHKIPNPHKPQDKPPEDRPPAK